MQTSRDVSAKNRGSHLEVRISTEQKSLFQQAATLLSPTLSEFDLVSSKEAAARTIQTHKNITLKRDEQIRLVPALLAAPAPNERLSDASRQHRAHTGV